MCEVSFEGEVVAGEPDHGGGRVFELLVVCGGVVLSERVFNLPCGFVVGFWLGSVVEVV